MNMSLRDRALLLAAVLALGACGRRSEPAPLAFPSEPSGRLEITYPLDETLFPPEIVAPTFVWSDETEGVAAWMVLLRFDGADEVLRFPTTEPRWRPSEDDWAEIKQRSVERDAEVAIVGVGADAKAASSASVRIRTSTDPVGDSIFYREVPLPFITAVQDPSRIRWRFGPIDSETAPPIVLENLPVCGNCHSFSDDGSVLGLDVDYGNDKGAYAILPVSEQMVLNDEKIITWSDYRRDDGELTFGLLSQVSPDGRYVISTVKDRSVFVATPDIWYLAALLPDQGHPRRLRHRDRHLRAAAGRRRPRVRAEQPDLEPGRQVDRLRPDEGLPEGRRSRTPRASCSSEKDVPEFVEDKKPFQFDLYRIPFNDGRGGTAEPIEGASHNGKSNYFAKFSPDGKWIVFCKAENYMLLQPDSELYIIPAAGRRGPAPARNTPPHELLAQLVVERPLARLLVEGQHALHPALPDAHRRGRQRHARRCCSSASPGADRAANIPEFVPLPGDAIAKIQEQFLDAYSFLRAGMANERTGNYAGAVQAYERGLAVEPDNVELLNALGFALFQQGKSQEAVVALEKALAVDPKHWKSHNNLALAAIELGELEVAEAHFRESLAIEPQPAIYNDLGFVLERQGLSEEAAGRTARRSSWTPSRPPRSTTWGRPWRAAASSPRPSATCGPRSRRTRRMRPPARRWSRSSRASGAPTRTDGAAAGGTVHARQARTGPPLVANYFLS